MPEPSFLLLLSIPVVIAAGFFHGAIGLGFPMIATPMIAIFVDVKAAIIITLLPTALVNIASVMSANSVTATVVKYQPLMLASLVGGIAGSILLSITSPDPYRLLLAVLILSFLFTTQYNIRFTFTPTTVAMIVFGVVAGLAGGTTNVMVAVLIVYFLSVGTERAEMVPAMNLCFLAGKSAQIMVFLVLGIVSLTTLLYTIPLALVSLVSLKVGQTYSERLDADRYRKILKGLLVGLAGILIVQFVSSL